MPNSTHRRKLSKLTVAAVSTTVGAALFASAIPANAAATHPGNAQQAAAVVEAATGTADIASSAAAPGTPAMAVTATEDGAVTVTAPDKANGAINAATDTGSSFGPTLPGAHDVSGVRAGAGTVVYPNASATTDIAVQPTKDGGARTLVTLKDANAPRRTASGSASPRG